MPARELDFGEVEPEDRRVSDEEIDKMIDELLGIHARAGHQIAMSPPAPPHVRVGPRVIRRRRRDE